MQQSYDFSSGGHSRTHSEGQGGAYQLTSMSTIHETPSTEQLGQTPRPQTKLNLPGLSRHGIETVDRNKVRYPLTRRLFMSPDVTSAFAKCASRDDEQGFEKPPWTDG
jgi:hypothetical protein